MKYLPLAILLTLIAIALDGSGQDQSIAQSRPLKGAHRTHVQRRRLWHVYGPCVQQEDQFPPLPVGPFPPRSFISGDLVPDSVAARIWLDSMAHLMNDDARHPGLFDEVIDQTELSDNDQSALKGIISTWYKKQQTLTTDYNADVEAGIARTDEQQDFAHHQAGLAMWVLYAKIPRELSLAGAARLIKIIRCSKASISMNPGVI